MRDVIVVGSGPAGCALAGRLAAGGLDVTLLEAGPDLGPQDSGRWDADLLDAAALSASYDWGYTSEDTYPGRAVAFERARVLGGCSSHNGCAAIWGARADYDALAPAGLEHGRADPALRGRDARLPRLHARRHHALPGRVPRGGARGRHRGHRRSQRPRRARGDRHLAGQYRRRRALQRRVRVPGPVEARRSWRRPGGAHPVRRHARHRRRRRRRGVPRRARRASPAGTYESPAILLRSGIGPRGPLARPIYPSARTCTTTPPTSSGSPARPSSSPRTGRARRGRRRSSRSPSCAAATARRPSTCTCTRSAGRIRETRTRGAGSCRWPA